MQSDIMFATLLHGPPTNKYLQLAEVASRPEIDTMTSGVKELR